MYSFQYISLTIYIVNDIINVCKINGEEIFMKRFFSFKKNTNCIIMCKCYDCAKNKSIKKEGKCYHCESCPGNKRKGKLLRIKKCYLYEDMFKEPNELEKS